MHKNYHLIIQCIGGLEISSFENIYRLSRMNYNECYWAVKGCEKHRFIELYHGQYELTDKGLNTYETE